MLNDNTSVRLAEAGSCHSVAFETFESTVVTGPGPSRTMCKVFAGVVLVVLAASNAFVDAERVVCSFSSSAAERTGEYAFEITDIPVSLCTHIVYDSLKLAIDVDSNDTPNILLANPDVAVGGWRKFAALKSIKPELKLLIGIRNPLIAQAASESDQRKALIELLIEYMSEYKLDGVDLFWGGYGIQSEQSLYLLVEELKSSFRAAGHPTWEVAILVAIDHEGIDHARLGRLLDFVNIIGAGERKPKYGNNSTMPSANALFDVDDQTNMTLNGALQYWIDKGCPADKILLVVFFIAEVFQLKKPNTVQTQMTYCTVPEDGPFCAYIEMCQKFNESDWTMGWDDTEGLAPHAFQTDYWAAYENEASVGRKGEIAREKGLAGVYAVALDLDDYRGKCGPAYPLLKSLSGSYRQKANN
ncbi:endochitinase-like [Anopheles merus]|uniref:endochitinase-like n=1 Tax=Anopheles merus TaxID=30066 RepID=UPI001BE3DF01|nr:endochitinase-like [Anopheles merus]